MLLVLELATGGTVRAAAAVLEPAPMASLADAFANRPLPALTPAQRYRLDTFGYCVVQNTLTPAETAALLAEGPAGRAAGGERRGLSAHRGVRQGARAKRLPRWEREPAQRGESRGRWGANHQLRRPPSDGRNGRGAHRVSADKRLFCDAILLP